MKRKSVPVLSFLALVLVVPSTLLAQPPAPRVLPTPGARSPDDFELFLESVLENPAPDRVYLPVWRGDCPLCRPPVTRAPEHILAPLVRQLSAYRTILGQIDWAACCKAPASAGNTSCPGGACLRINYAPVRVCPPMQWGVATAPPASPGR